MSADREIQYEPDPAKAQQRLLDVDALAKEWGGVPALVLDPEDDGTDEDAWIEFGILSLVDVPIPPDSVGLRCQLVDTGDVGTVIVPREAFLEMVATWVVER